MKKIFSLLLAGVLSLGLVGCGGSSKSDETAKTDIQAWAGKTVELRAPVLLLGTDDTKHAAALTLEFGDVATDGKSIAVKSIAAVGLSTKLFVATAAGNVSAAIGDKITLTDVKVTYESDKKLATLVLPSLGVAETGANAIADLRFHTINMNLLSETTFTATTERAGIAAGGTKGNVEGTNTSGVGAILVK